MDEQLLEKLRKQTREKAAEDGPPPPRPLLRGTGFSTQIWKCPQKECLWMWSLTEVPSGKVIDSGSQPTEALARQEAMEAIPLPEPQTIDTLPRSQLPPPEIRSELRWSYGVTTVPSRRGKLLNATLASLREAGFDKPRLFVDGDIDASWRQEFPELEISSRYPTIRAYGNWMLALWELYLRDPEADRYAIFQDDFVTYRNLRGYLDRCLYPKRSYWNLYTMPSNTYPGHAIAPKDPKWIGWYPSNQFGRGAVGLVFDLETVSTILSARHMVDRVHDPKRGHCKIDGGLVEALKKEGYTEYVHAPSLVQHTGEISAIGNPKNPKSPIFLGQEFDAMDLLKENVV